ncbi:cytochrome P450 [Pleurotus eryngii]|uniref:Cytochrome P450 n=1 Tax=Pleurotus eryngii TaxID=5323 RepID=A0A9P5ZMS9_PLEER|nr:cytochrome P450 [Pleurotus eryngii]
MRSIHGTAVIVLITKFTVASTLGADVHLITGRQIVRSHVHVGGAETSQLVLSTFFAAMPLYPKKGQEELDTYLSARLPMALLRDEEYYPDPDTFNPERFLKDDEIKPKTLDLIPNFGFGRRICSGRFFAMDSLLMSIASMPFCFDVTKAKDSEGRDIEPDIRCDPGFTKHIVPFKCSITPRSAEAAKMFRDSKFK